MFVVSASNTSKIQADTPTRRFPPPWSVGGNATLFQSPRRFPSRSCMNFANATPPRMNRHKTTNMTKLFVGVGTFSGKRAVGSMGDVLTVARNVLNRDVIDIRIIRTFGKIAATLGVIGAIAASVVRLSSSSSLLPSSLLCLLRSLRSRTLLPLRWGRLLTLETEL
jgi:hypothetical protein